MADSNAASPRVPDPFYDSDATTSEITITITHRNIAYTFDFDPSATLTDLSNAIADQMSIPHATQKLLIPKHGLQKPPGGDGDEDEDVDDHGGWQGGEFVVGGGSAPSQGLSRREILAKAAEERLKRMNMDRPDGGRPDSGPSS
ncbi:NifU-like protein [Verticillium dahliae VDG2]|nr:NifU-like protein [Verticillium dahliae VDG2]